ncbi:MAG: transferase [Ignavibacteria bacterium]|nr:transferase [Ignavibacteria bacterium]
MTIYLFEHSPEALLPLTHLRPAYDLRCGAYTALERTQVLFPGVQLALGCRAQLRDVLAERTGLPVNALPDGPVLFLNGAALLTRDLAAMLLSLPPRDTAVTCGGALFAAIAVGDPFRAAMFEDRADAQALAAVHIEADCDFILRPWDLIARNDAMLREDAGGFPLGTVSPDADVAASAELIVPEQICIAAGARIGAGVVIDASDGPVFIGARSRVMHQAVLLGPVAIGADSTVKVGAKIYHGVSAGPQCKLGGEVEESIFHSYANKQHDGFVGHSYFAPWTNLGADTNTSDLKNNYSGIRMTLEGAEHRTGLMFLGTIMADHAKTGINTMLNTGTCAGVASNIYGGGFPPKFLPSFSWGGADGLVEYDFDRCAAVADTVMRRRGLSLTVAERALLRFVFESTRGQR